MPGIGYVEHYLKGQNSNYEQTICKEKVLLTICTPIIGYVDHSRPKIVCEYDQEIPQSQTADNPMAP